MTNPLAGDLDHVLAHTGGVWGALSGARIFVTGGTGFVGCWLLESFAWACGHLALDASMTVLTRSPEAFGAKAPHLASHPAIHLVRGDVRTFAFPEGRFSHVIHGATQASETLNREQPLEMLETIVDGTRRTLDMAAACGARRFLLLSSGAVYGAQPPEIGHLPETYRGGPDPADPASAYAEGKRLAELLATLYSRDGKLDCLVARCFAFVGPYLPLDAHFAIGNFIRDGITPRPVEIRGDGAPLRSYLYAADLAIWLWTILVMGEPCRPYNVGSDRELSIRELANTVARTLGTHSPVRVAGVPCPGAAPERYIPSTGRARRELGLEQWVGLEEAILRTAAWAAGSRSRRPSPLAAHQSYPRHNGEARA
jgi:dTDP-glucose 4,6-dehydratase